jgi:cell division protein FtsB
VAPRKHRKLLARALLVVGALAVLYVAAGGVHGLVGWRRLSRDVGELERQVRHAEVMIDSLEREIVRLRTDTAFIERTAREKLGMVRRDEKVYKFVEGR